MSKTTKPLPDLPLVDLHRETCGDTGELDLMHQKAAQEMLRDLFVAIVEGRLYEPSRRKQ